ncbi:1,4-alpha-glucan branching protein GlgB [Dyella sedimenti]|uniref:1,4-alpha-glucan branching protein GlgB n=1 Tax=Dyella sedimenti TaxID=2919947 RepID=UPI001FAA1A91|nr:1,4-alpha-glucan branching protein GlgB [Dyella sedimenti]
MDVAPSRESAEAAQLARIAVGDHPDPFAWLGPHRTPRGWVVRACLPFARRVEVMRMDGSLWGTAAEAADGVFVATADEAPGRYALHVQWEKASQRLLDPYAFAPLLDEATLQAFHEGRLHRPESHLGAHPMTLDGVDGVRFAVWAPNAHRVSVVGDFNGWDGRRHVMRLRHRAGVWEIFIPGAEAGARYKYELLDGKRSLLPLKADPYALRMEHPPASASIVAGPLSVKWHDTHWLAQRASHQRRDAPLSIYEVHATSWRHHHEGAPPDWDELARELIPYVQELGFTHIELLPVSEHPFGGSWGYQPLGIYAPTARLGNPEAFARFVDSCHVAGLGIIVDWVGAHFPDDPHGLARFDGTALYEHADPREGFHQDWHTLIYNYGRREVAQYLIGSALSWIDRFHVDGLRIDAVASMLYRDYSRGEGQWIPNHHGGRENLEAIGLLRELNRLVAEQYPGVLTIAEESTAWPGVTARLQDGGLGFTYKWNMGWMHDSLRYLRRNPIYRRFHHHDLTFGMTYAYAERFILALSHDEVVYGKGSLLQRMPGDAWQRFANLRAYFGFMWAHPGKKLLFMGDELAAWREWDHDGQLDWSLRDDPMHEGVRRLVADLNRLLVNEPALHQEDDHPRGFAWIVADDAMQSVYAFVRYGNEGAPPMLAVSNFTPQPRDDYRVGVPEPGRWRELCNTDSAFYGGSNVGNGGVVSTLPQPSHGYAQSLTLRLPPLATLILRAEDA